MITSGFQRGLMKAVGASAGTLRRLSAFISRRVCTAASTPCAAGPCCSPTFRSAKSMNTRRRRRIADLTVSPERTRFRTGLPVEGACDRTGRPFLCMSASQRLLWHGARRRPSDARRKHACHGRDKHHRRCSFKRRLARCGLRRAFGPDRCYDPDRDAHEALLRSGFGGRVQVV
uniref:Uncharacterized protein n=1 Tax=Escherichia coli TaxID=562 RepID=A0A8F1IF33_ECOLX|nr:hypothetical protein IHCLGBEB_00029 [Escherichia coli]